MLFARFHVGFFIILNNCQKKFKQSTFYEDIFFFSKSRTVFKIQSSIRLLTYGSNISYLMNYLQHRCWRSSRTSPTFVGLPVFSLCTYIGIILILKVIQLHCLILFAWYLYRSYTFFSIRYPCASSSQLKVQLMIDKYKGNTIKTVHFFKISHVIFSGHKNRKKSVQ